MEFWFGAENNRASSDIPPNQSFSHVSLQNFHSNHPGNDCSRNECFRNQNENDMREAIRRELEKERIRQEIIVEEIVRRRELEWEVRGEMMLEKEIAFRRRELEWEVKREMMLEREIAFRSGRGYSTPIPPMQFDPRHSSTSNPFDHRQLEERMRFQSQRSEVRKDKVIVLPQPSNRNLCGVKKKATTPPMATITELTKKKPTEEWSCALCQVTATSKEGLDEHLQGKRHKAKKVELRAHKAGTKSGTTSPMATITGLSPAGTMKKPTEWSCNLCQVTATSKEGLDEHLQGKRHKAKKAELGAQKAGTKSGTTSPMATITELSPAGTRKKPTEEWSCDLCQITATCKEGLNEHLQGRRHKAKEAGMIAQKAGNKSGNISASIEPKASFTPSLKQDLKQKDLSQKDQHDGAVKKEDLQDLKKKHESELRKKVEVKTSTKNDGKEVKLGVPKMERPKKKNRKFKFMCEMCQVEANSEVDIAAHKKGRKHRARFEMHQKLLH